MGRHDNWIQNHAPPPARWHVITESSFPWGQDALDFVRERLPDQEPYHAWTNFEFIADQGSVNEVDLLVLAPGGFYLIEIKSRPGTVEGDAHTWTWRDGAHEHVIDNPLLLTNRKARRLISLIRQQPAALGVSSSSTIRTRTTGGEGVEAGAEEDVHRFEERLRYAIARGSFLALGVPPKYLQSAERRLARRYPVAPVSLDALLISAMRKAALQAGADWSVVRQADAAGPAAPTGPTSSASSHARSRRSRSS